MNGAVIRLYARMGRKLLWPIQWGKLANYARYRFMIPFVRRWGPDKLLFSPPNIVIAVTARCNKQCDFCYFSGELNRGGTERLELTHRRFQEILNHPLVVNGLRIALTGGEPLLNKDIFKMIRDARNRRHVVSVITNGVLLKKLSPQILETPPDLLTVTYYPEEHEGLAAALPLLGGRVPIRLHFVLSRGRMRHLDRFFAMAVENGIRTITLEHVNLSDAPATEESAIRPGDREFQSLKARMEREYGKKLSILWWPIVGDHKPHAATRCRVFWHSVHLDALGRISPCCEWPMSTYHDDIFSNRDAWNSRTMIALRRRMRHQSVPDACRACSFIYKDYLAL